MLITHGAYPQIADNLVEGGRCGDVVIKAPGGRHRAALSPLRHLGQMI